MCDFIPRDSAVVSVVEVWRVVHGTLQGLLNDCGVGDNVGVVLTDLLIAGRLGLNLPATGVRVRQAVVCVCFWSLASSVFLTVDLTCQVPGSAHSIQSWSTPYHQGLIVPLRRISKSQSKSGMQYSTMLHTDKSQEAHSHHQGPSPQISPPIRLPLRLADLCTAR